MIIIPVMMMQSIAIVEGWSLVYHDMIAWDNKQCPINWMVLLLLFKNKL